MFKHYLTEWKMVEAGLAPGMPAPTRKPVIPGAKPAGVGPAGGAGVQPQMKVGMAARATAPIMGKPAKAPPATLRTKPMAPKPVAGASPTAAPGAAQSIPRAPAGMGPQAGTPAGAKQLKPVKPKRPRPGTPMASIEHITMFDDLVGRWLAEAGGTYMQALIKSPPEQVRAAGEVMKGVTGPSHPEASHILARALAKRAIKQQGMGPIQRGIALVRAHGAGTSSVNDDQEAGEPSSPPVQPKPQGKPSASAWAKYYQDSEEPSREPMGFPRKSSRKPFPFRK